VLAVQIPAFQKEAEAQRKQKQQEKMAKKLEGRRQEESSLEPLAWQLEAESA